MPISSLNLALSSGYIQSGLLGNSSVLSGNIGSGQIGINHLASGTSLSVDNAATNRIITSLNSGNSSIQANTNLTYDGTTLSLNSVASGSVLFTVNGVNGELLRITDSAVDEIFTVDNSSGSVIFTVHNDGFTETTSAIFSGQSANFQAFKTNQTNGSAAFVDYYVKNSTTNGLRAGTVVAAWDNTNDGMKFTETTTQDVGGDTDGLLFIPTIQSGNFVLGTQVSNGVWNGKLGVRIL
jgi:hypothetical protein